MKTIFLVRHGLPDFPNGQPICMGKRFDLPLGEAGRQQAEELARSFPDIRLEAVYTSPARRCFETAKPLAQRFALPCKVIDDMIELRGGLWDGMTNREIHEKYPEYFSPGANLTPPGGESDEEGLARAMAAIRQMLADTEHYCACVTHSSLIRVISCAVLKRPFSQKRRVLVDYAGVFPLHWDGSQFTCGECCLTPAALTQLLSEGGPAF